MKRILLYLALTFTIFLSSCDTLNKIAGVLAPSEFEMVTGLKDALSQGLFKSFDAFADPMAILLYDLFFPEMRPKLKKHFMTLDWINW